MFRGPAPNENRTKVPYLPELTHSLTWFSTLIDQLFLFPIASRWAQVGIGLVSYRLTVLISDPWPVCVVVPGICGNLFSGGTRCANTWTPTTPTKQSGPTLLHRGERGLPYECVRIKDHVQARQYVPLDPLVRHCQKLSHGTPKFRVKIGIADCGRDSWQWSISVWKDHYYGAGQI